jgi:2-polyprenyl-6-hydroxyphenyl methylase/3-demethylubiquinone-9 3-methyltransferase
MEHLIDPLQTLEDLIKAAKPNGYLIFGNCFFPVIQCHLPQTFHLRYTFNHFARLMGLTPVVSLHHNYITVFKKENSAPVNWSNTRRLELISKLCYPPLNAAHMAYRKLKSS